ncbi:MAG: purine-nucleoside phosphorylase [Candidatus Cryosericum sp.]
MDALQLQQEVRLATDSLVKRMGSDFGTMVVLGSGLSSFVSRIQDAVTIPYSAIPGFPRSTVKGHLGELVGGTIGKQRVLCLAGRFHYYEGYDTAALTIPVRVGRALGVRTALFTNAAGGVRDDLRLGDLMIIRDQLNLMQADSPLRGLPDDEFGSRFVNMYNAYDRDMAEALTLVGTEHHLPMTLGVYAAMSGPQFETRAEIRMLRVLGADAVGMSTVPEVIVANHLGMRVGGISVITDLATETTSELSHEQVLDTAGKADGQLAELLAAFIDGGIA